MAKRPQTRKEPDHLVAGLGMIRGDTQKAIGRQHPLERLGAPRRYALNYKDGVIYTATAQGGGGLTNAFHAFDLASRR